jgi:hypothetical protein
MFQASGDGSFVNVRQSSSIERNTATDPFQIAQITDGAVGVFQDVAVRFNNPVEVSSK